MAGPISFTRMTDEDLPLLHDWMNEPGVVRWWEGEDVSMAAIERDYSAGVDPLTEHWIAEQQDAPIGWIQCWPATSYEEESAPWFDAGVAKTAAGIDYLIADPGRRGTGLGTAMIRAFTFDVVFGRHCEWTQVAASPFAANIASVRALEKAGFRLVASLTYPVAADAPDDGPCSLMVIDRPQG